MLIEYLYDVMIAIIAVNGKISASFASMIAEFPLIICVPSNAFLKLCGLLSSSLGDVVPTSVSTKG